MGIKKFDFCLTYILILFALFHGVYVLFFGFTNVSPSDNNAPVIFPILRDISFILFFLVVIATRRFIIPDKYLKLLSFFIVILIIFSIPVLINLESFQHVYRNFLGYVFFIFIGINLKLSNVDLKNIFRNLINLISISSFFCIFSILNDNFLWNGRIFGSLFGPNTAASIFFLGLCLNFNNKLSFFVIVKDLLLITSLLLTASFGAIISYVLFFILFFNRNALKKYSIYLFIITLFIAFDNYFELFQIKEYFNIFSTKLHAVFYGEIFTIENRIAQYTQFFNSFFLNPFKFLIVNYEINSYITNDSLFLQIVNNHGILSLLVFLFFIFTIIKYLIDEFKKIDSSYYFQEKELLDYIKNFLRFFKIFFIINCSITASLYHYPVNCIVWLCIGLLFNFFAVNKNT